MRTDTEMLEWFVRHRMFGISGSDEKGWIVYDQSNGLTFISARRDTFREAINEAMDKRP
jgi:hypothetical protein